MTAVGLLAIACAAGMAWGFARRERAAQFPFLFTCAFAGFILPQLAGIAADAALPSGGVTRTGLFAIVCLLSGWAGYAVADGRTGRPALVVPLVPALALATALLFVGGVFQLAMMGLSLEALAASNWSGAPARMYFFAVLHTYGFALASVLAFRTGDRRAVVLVAIGLAIVLAGVVVQARRAPAIGAATAFLSAAWLAGRKSPPRALVAAALVGAILYVYVAPELRMHARRSGGSPLAAAAEVDWLAAFLRNFDGTGAEVRNAVHGMAAVAETGRWDLGLYHWDVFVAYSVPAFVVGKSVKESLLTGHLDPPIDRSRFRPTPGATWTGLSDAFASFGWLGCLKFFVVGFVMRWLHDRGAEGSLLAQVTSAVMLSRALGTVTHTTDKFVSPWTHLVPFLILPLWLLAIPWRASEGSKPREEAESLPANGGRASTERHP